MKNRLLSDFAWQIYVFFYNQPCKNHNKFAFLYYFTIFCTIVLFL